MANGTDAWLRTLARAEGGTIVFAFPPAGSGPAVFRPWLPVLPDHVELVAVNTPGREDRMAEPPPRSVSDLADRCAEEILRRADRQFVIFGHSLGALLGREVAARLRSDRLRLLAVAGAAAPDRPVPSRADASDADLLSLLAEWGGTPQAVLGDPGVYSLFLPCLRADFAVADACRRPLAPGDALDTPILALAGDGDRHAAPAECAHWSRWTSAAFTLRVVPGGHFFPFQAADTVLGLLAPWLAGPVRRDERAGALATEAWP